VVTLFTNQALERRTAQKTLIGFVELLNIKQLEIEGRTKHFA
jgi:hypothetical protein